MKYSKKGNKLRKNKIIQNGGSNINAPRHNTNNNVNTAPQNFQNSYENASQIPNGNVNTAPQNFQNSYENASQIPNRNRSTTLSTRNAQSVPNNNFSNRRYWSYFENETESQIPNRYENNENTERRNPVLESLLFGMSGDGGEAGEAMSCALGSLVTNVANFGRGVRNTTKRTLKKTGTAFANLGRRTGAAAVNLGRRTGAAAVNLGRRGISKAKNLTFRAGSKCVLFFKSLLNKIKTKLFTTYKTSKDYLILIMQGYKAYGIYNKIMAHSDNLQKTFITINEILNNDLKTFIINLKGLNLDGASANNLDIINRRNQEIYRENHRCLEYFKTHPEENMLNIVKLFLSLHTENIANMFKEQIEQISFILPILDNFIDYSNLPTNGNNAEINLAITENQLFTYYAVKLQNNIYIEDLEILLSLFLGIILESRNDSSTLIFKLNTLLELVRILYWRFKYYSEINSNQQLKDKLLAHIEILKGKFNNMPEAIKILSEKFTDESFVLFTNKYLRNFFVNLLDENESKFKEYLELIKLYSYFNNPIAVDGPIPLFNLQNLLINYLNNMLEPIRKFANLGILDELIKDIMILSNLSTHEIQSIPRINITQPHQSGGAFKTFKARFGTIFNGIIAALLKKNITQKTNIYDKDYKYNPTTNTSNIINNNCGWTKFKDNINIDINIDINNHTIFSIIDNPNNCPILSAIISTISINGSDSKKFDKDSTKLILKYFNENIYNFIYGKKCLLNETGINIRDPEHINASPSSHISPRTSPRISPRTSPHPKKGFFHSLFTKKNHSVHKMATAAAAAAANSNGADDNHDHLRPEIEEFVEGFKKISLQNVTTANGTLGINSSDVAAKSRKIAHVNDVLSIMGGIGLQHICNGLSIGNLTLDSIRKFDNNLGLYLSLNAKIFKLSYLKEKIKDLIRCKIIYGIISGNIETLMNDLKIKYKLLIENYNDALNIKTDFETKKRTLESEYSNLTNNLKKTLSKQKLKQMEEYTIEITTCEEYMKKIRIQMQNEFNLIYNIISGTTYPNTNEILSMFITPTAIEQTILENIEDTHIQNNIIEYKNIFYIHKICYKNLKKWIDNWIAHYDKINIIDEHSIPIGMKVSLLTYNLFINSPIIEDLYEYSIRNTIIVCKETNTLILAAREQEQVQVFHNLT